MKKITKFTPILAVLFLISCGTPEPLFKFENYNYDNNNDKRPLTVEYSFVTISNASKSKALTAIEESLRYEFFEIDGNLPSTLERTFDKGVAQFRAESGYDDTNQPIGCELKVSSEAKVYGNTLSYTIEGYKFSGGAHGLSWHTGLNYDIESGELLSLHDFLSDEQTEALPAILREHLCADKGIYNEDPFEALTRLGYYPNEILPTENFRLTNDGIEFLYNPYEIGVYAVGMTAIKIPYEILDKITVE